MLRQGEPDSEHFIWDWNDVGSLNPYWTPHSGAFRDNTQRSRKQKLTHPAVMVPQVIVKVVLKWDREEETQAKMQ